MYLDQSTSHHRFAAYEMGDPNGPWNDNAAYNRWQMDFSERELEARMSAASRSSADSRRSLNAQIKAEAARLKLATRQLEEIGIPELQLKQWVANKQNRIAELGMQLDYARAFAEYSSNPDLYWIRNSFKQSFQRMGNNPWTSDPDMNRMVTQQDTSTQPQPQSLQSLVADLTGGTGAGAAAVDQANAQAASGAPGGGGNNPAASGMSDGVSAIQQLVQSSPPSPYDGLNQDDAAVLQNIQRIYSQPGGLAALPLNTLESMDPAQRGLLLGGGARLGHYNPSELARYQNSRWQEGNARYG